MAKAKKKKKIDLLNLEQEFRELGPIMESFAVELTNQLDKILKEAGIRIGFPIQQRVKQWESLADKLNVFSANEELNVDLLEKTLDLLWPQQNKSQEEDFAILLDELLHFDNLDGG